MRKIRILTLFVAFTMALGINAFAFVVQDPPIDPNNPVVTYRYTCTDGKNFDKLTFDMTGQAKIILNGVVYDTDKEYKEVVQYDEGYAVMDNKLYKLHWLEKSGPTLSEETDYTGLSYFYKMELVPTDEKPEFSYTEIIRHDNITENIETKYLVDGVEVAENAYNQAKYGAYTEYMKKRYVDQTQELNHLETKFTGLEENEVDRVWSNGKVEKIIKAVLLYTCDEYWDVTQNYIKTYEIVYSVDNSVESAKSEAYAALNSVDVSAVPENKAGEVQKIIEKAKADVGKATTVYEISQIVQKANEDIKNLTGKDFEIQIGKPNITDNLPPGLISLKAVDKFLKGSKTGKFSVGSYEPLKLTAKAKKKKVNLSWKKVDRAKKYSIYAAQKGQKFKKIATTKKTKYSVRKIKKDLLKKGKSYRFVVVAERDKLALAVSKPLTVKLKK